MRTVKTAALAVLSIVYSTGTASATPNMIRLGYPTCSACHLSPQGGGLLTTYGKGIDAAQSLEPEEVREEGMLGGRRRVVYDVRFSLGLDRVPPAATGYGFNTSVRSAFAVGHHRVVYAASLASPTLARTRTSGAVNIRMSRLFWLYQPREGLSLTVGRDDLPTGLGLPGATSFARRVTSPDVSSTPTQAKLFWWNDRWQAATYAFGPDGNESAARFEAYGVGGLIGADVWKNRAVVGLTTRASRADAYDRRSAGIFVRAGLSRHWGVLFEHEISDRITDKGAEFIHQAGHSEVFFVPYDWLQTSIGVDHVTTRDGAESYRFSPAAQVRLNRNISLSFNTRDVLNRGGTAAGRSRTYSLQVMVKTVE